MRRAFFLVIILLGLSTVSCSKKENLLLIRSNDPEFIKGKLAKYATVELTYNKKFLTPREQKILKKLVQAAQYMDPIFWQQSSPKGLWIKKQLEKSQNPLDRYYLRFLKINYGPFDRQEGDKPFIGTKEKPLGAGFYPEDMTREEFEEYVEAHPEVRKEFYKLNTLIRRQGKALVAIPYERAYRKYLEPAARLLREAAQLSVHGGLKKYLSLRAEALLSGDFFESDMAWVDLTDNVLDIVIGPIETYEDRLLGLKASYEGIVLIRDFKETRKLKVYQQHIPNLERNLPVPRVYKKSKPAPLAPIGVFTTVFVSGEANAGVKSIAFSLPNDERVREQKGARAIQQKNIILAKFEKILVPISQRLIREDQQPLIDGEAFFTNILLHELAHPLGLNYVRGQEGVTVRQALKDYYGLIEEAKADVVGLYNVRYFVRKGVIPAEKERSFYVTYLASIFRSVRFGATEAHAKANVIEFNYLAREGAFNFDPASGKYWVNFNRIRSAIKKLAAELLMIEGDGNYKKAQHLVQNFGKIPSHVQRSLKQLADIPVDVEFVFDPELMEN